MRDYEFYNPTCVEYGAVNNIQRFVKDYDLNNIAIITGPVLYRLNAHVGAAEAVKSVGAEVAAVFKDVPNDGSIEVVNAIVSKLTESDVDGIIAIGGGSVLDTAKAARYAYVSESKKLGEGLDPIRDEVTRRVPLACIPTTTGTGSECTPVVVLKNSADVKTEILSNELLPEFALLSPESIATLPLKSLCFTAFDALTHAIEALTSRANNPLSDSFAVLAISKIGGNLLKASEGGKDAAAELLIAANLAGTAFGSSMVGLAHALAHSLGSRLKISHDLACAIVLPAVMRFNRDLAKDKYAVAASAFYGSDFRGQSEDFADGLERLIKEIADKFGADVKLSAYGLDESNIKQIAHGAYRDGARISNIRTATERDAEDILRLLI